MHNFFVETRAALCIRARLLFTSGRKLTRLNDRARGKVIRTAKNVENEKKKKKTVEYAFNVF